jgi:hypothetical protein
MKFDDAIKTLLDLFPDMEVLEDEDGQVVIYTGMRSTKDGLLIPFTPTKEN